MEQYLCGCHHSAETRAGVDYSALYSLVRGLLVYWLNQMPVVANLQRRLALAQNLPIIVQAETHDGKQYHIPY